MVSLDDRVQLMEWARDDDTWPHQVLMGVPLFLVRAHHLSFSGHANAQASFYLGREFTV